MCGGQEMESYEEFCLQSLATLREEKGQFKKVTRKPLCSLKALSVIRFYGRAVLSPLLSAEQRAVMCGHRERAVQREVDRQNQQRNKLLDRVHDILGQAQTHNAQSEEVDKLAVSKSATVSGYTLVTDSPGLPREPGFGLQTDDRLPTPISESPILSGYNTVEEVKVMSEEKSEEEEEDDDDISLDSLLKKSREYVKREQSQPGSEVAHTVTRTPMSETVPVKETRTCSPTGDTGIEFGFSLYHSLISTPQNPIQHQSPYDPSFQQSGGLSPSLPERYAYLPSIESSISPCARRRKPRPVSTGNIHISFPIGPADFISRNAGRPGEGASMADWGEALVGATKSSDHRGSVGSEGGGRSGNRQSIHCGSSPVHKACSPISASKPSTMGHHDPPAASFRRRCHTLDSQLHTDPSGAEHIDRSQERTPRFMAGATWLAPSRHTPAAALNQSYDIENPSPTLLRPYVAPDMTHVTLRMEPDDPQGPNNGRIRNAPEAEAGKTEETQRRTQALEDMQRRLEEEHVLQMSRLLAEQEEEQQCLRMDCNACACVQELEETERRLTEQDCVRPLSGDGYAWNRRSVSDSCPVVSPCCHSLAHTPSERSPGHSRGFPSPVSPSVCTPSVQPPVYLWGPTWAASKPRARLSLILTAEQQMAFCRIGAITRGFLTRRLLRTEKVKHLRQTIVDTQEFIRSFKTEAPQKRCTFSAQDLSLQERVRAQLRAALYDIHDIFFEMPLGDRLVLLQQDRELRAERKLRDLEKTKCPKERAVLSAATQRSLDRKNRVGESPAQPRKMQQKPKSPTTNRVLKPSQCQNSSAQGQLNRQGSWYRKTPEERVKRSDSLKKQHSLG